MNISLAMLKQFVYYHGMRWITPTRTSRASPSATATAHVSSEIAGPFGAAECSCFCDMSCSLTYQRVNQMRELFRSAIAMQQLLQMYRDTARLHRLSAAPGRREA